MIEHAADFFQAKIGCPYCWNQTPNFIACHPSHEEDLLQKLRSSKCGDIILMPQQTPLFRGLWYDEPPLFRGLWYDEPPQTDGSGI